MGRKGCCASADAPKAGQGRALAREATALGRRGPWVSGAPVGRAFLLTALAWRPRSESAEKPGGRRRHYSILGAGSTGEGVGESKCASVRLCLQGFDSKSQVSSEPQNLVFTERKGLKEMEDN